MKRVVVPELLDSDAGTQREIQRSLEDLRMINLVFGGVRTMQKLLQAVAQRRGLRSLEWLDVGGASGDIAELTNSRLMTAAGIHGNTTVLDRAFTHLNGRGPAVCGNALALPFGDDTFDVVASSLFVHHLEPEQLAAFIREGLRVARHAVIVNDLVRNPVHLAFVYAGFPLYRSRLTRHDAPASVRRAYTAEELRTILCGTGAASIQLGIYYFFRLGAIAWKQPETSMM
ncbi:MAG TPA: methyltransferase domain-containing protein [Terriglobales bacterium]|nr:methyltransferase domain-containing protein [Terriglobales bacterium]